MFKFGLRLVAAVGITLCVSCSAGQQSSSKDGPKGPAPASSHEEEIKQIPALPVAEYSIGKDAGYDLDLARVVVVNDCLAKRGTGFRLPEPARPEAAGNSRRYGVVDQGIAAAYGFHDPGDENASPPSPAMNAAQKKLLLGSGGTEKGCMAAAESALGSGEPPKQSVEVARTIDVTSFKESQASPDVKKAFAEWSMCMSKEGYVYASPLQSAGDKWYSVATATAEEKRVARADVSCKNEVDLVERWHKAESNIQRRMIDRHAKELKVLMTFQEGLTKRARDVLGKT